MSYWTTLKNGKSVEVKDIESICKSLQDTFAALVEQKEYYQKKLQNYDRDIEVRSLKQEIEDVYNHSLVQLSDKELKAIKNFHKQHWESCFQSSKKQGTTYIYTLSGTGIGITKEITCPICGTTADVTDIDSW